AGRQAFLVARAVAVDRRPELVPVDRPVVVVLAFLVPLEVGIGQRDAEHLGLGHGGIDEFLAQLIVGDALDAPAHALRAVRAVGVGRPEHRQALPPPAIDGVLDHGLLFGGTGHHDEQGFVTLALVEGFLLADAHHGPGVGAVGAAAERDLVHDRGAIDQPADHANVGPGQGRVVEDRAVFGAAAMQAVEHLVAAGAQGLGGGIEVEAVAALVLDLGDQDGLALETRGARNPVAFGQHADDFAVGVLADLADQGLAVGLGHPVLRLDAAVGIDAGVEGGLQGRVFAGGPEGDGLRTGGVGYVERLCVHEVLRWGWGRSRGRWAPAGV